MKIPLQLLAIIGFIVFIGAVVFMMITPKTPENKDIIAPVLTPTSTPPLDYYSPPPILPKEDLDQNKIDIINLGIGDISQLKNREIALVDVVADSRCPKGVQCIWAGEVKIGLKYRNISTSFTKDFTLTYPKADEVIVDGYKMELISVIPEKTIDPIDKKAYQIQISIRQVGGNKVPPPTETSLGEGLGTLSGSVLIGPMCPVMREGVECPDRGAPDVALLIINIKSGLSYTVTTDSSGAFTLPVEAGTYNIKNGSTKPYPMISPIEVVVKAGVVTSVVMHGDSGIR